MKGLLLTSCWLGLSSGHFSSSSSDKFIYDDSGRVSIFHGANAVNKGFPWYPPALLDEAQIEEMQSWGFNTLRLGVMWTGVEPQMGVYNDTYLEIVSSILDTLEAHGIAAIIDVHQDVLSTYFCEYDGAPTWLVDLSTSSEKAFPWPLPGSCSDRPWGSNYLAEATGAAFQDMYDDVNGMREHFGKFWRKLATTFKDKKILAYEIINEPWAGNIYAKPSLLLPGVAGTDNLQPLYDVISRHIREVDPDHIIMYEPVTWGMILNGTATGSGFTHVPGGEDFKSKSIFSFHYYCWWFGNDGSYNKYTCDEKFGPKVFSQVDEDIRQLGGAAMLTEWGQGCDPDNGYIDECNAIFDLSDEYLTSWASWYYIHCQECASWSFGDKAVEVFSRTYAQRIAGTPTKMHYDYNSHAFELCYVVNAAISEPTEIYASFDLHYANGVEVQTRGTAARYMKVSLGDAGSNKIYVTFVASDDPPLSEPLECCVHVKPA